MKLIKLESKIKISELPVALSSTDLKNDLKSCTPGEWAVFQFNLPTRFFIGFANPFVENKKILRLIKEVNLDLLKFEDEEIVKTILEEYISIASRRREFCKGILGKCYRMFYGDQDGLPGLIIDMYNNALVLQMNTAGIDRYKNIVTSFLKKHHTLPILCFENAYLRKNESLPSEQKVVSDLEFLEVIDNDLLLKIPVTELQKAGFYFDHSYNRRKLLHLLNDLKLGPLKVLDLFCYAGAWGFGLIKNNFARYVIFVDQGDFSRTLAETAKCNLISVENYKFRRTDVFTFFKEDTEKYDLIICDPPAFAKSSGKIANALEGYKKLFHECLRRINKNGILVAASCTHGINLEDFSKLVRSEARKVDRSVSILDIGTQRIDHPISSLSGSAFYLKYICYYVN